MSLIHVPSVDQLLNRIIALSERSKITLEEHEWSMEIYGKAVALLAFFEETPNSQTYFTKLCALREALENRPVQLNEKDWKALAPIFRRRYDMEIIRGQERAIQEIASRQPKNTDELLLKVRRRDRIARWFSRK